MPHMFSFLFFNLELSWHLNMQPKSDHAENLPPNLGGPEDKTTKPVSLNIILIYYIISKVKYKNARAYWSVRNLVSPISTSQV